MDQRRVRDVQLNFLHKLIQLLEKVEDTLSFAMECYSNGDSDIGDRVVKQVLEGLIPYNQENITVRSIFYNNEVALVKLNEFQATLVIARNLESLTSIKEKVTLINHELEPQLLEWKQTLIMKRAELSRMT